MALRECTKAGVVGVAAAAMAATAFVAPAQATPHTPDAGTGHRATQRAMDAIVKAGTPGITAQARDTDGVWKSASGVGDLDSGAPRGKDDKFRVGSITKTFVATVLLSILVQDRRSRVLRLSSGMHLPVRSAVPSTSPACRPTGCGSPPPRWPN
ncbi:serine hydrolase [Streptomyces sp. NPDC050147]|uniref:serine hydrolase n=1 Tax=Streptomyces sp. NPDC050147 TaxID=3155513 RepID=UPI0034430972